MDTQDKLLVGSLKRLGYPVQDNSQMESFQFAELAAICTYFLRRSGETVEEVKAGANMSQRFKIVSPIIEKMKVRGVTVDMTLLLNPNPNDVRNLLLSILSKSE